MAESLGDESSTEGLEIPADPELDLASDIGVAASMVSDFAPADITIDEPIG